MKATIFQNFASDSPFYLSVDSVLERIKKCHISQKIDNLRQSTDKVEIKKLKNSLPCICFSGKFTTRNDKSIVEHSGFAIMDFDKLNEPTTFRDNLKIYPFIYSAFISPSGNGVKALVRIPADAEKHKGHYLALLKKFPTADPTSKNVSRICYESCDADLWINSDAVEFTEFVDENEVKKSIKNIHDAVRTDYSKINISAEMIRNSVDGEKHETLLRASKLAGGYIAAGLITESEAYRILEYEISLKDVTDFAGAKKTIKDGIEYGKQYPIEVREYEPKHNAVQSIKPSVSQEFIESLSFLAAKNEIDEYLLKWRTGKFEMGLTTGFPSFDEHFRFKRGNFNVFNGFDNVGKSTTIWYFAVVSAMLHDWNWLIYTSENKSGNFFKKAMEFYWGISIIRMTESQYKIAYEFIAKHFKIIANEQIYNYKDILTMSLEVKQKYGIDGVLADPYNSLKIDLSDGSKLSTHEYHYEAASEMQLFAKKNDTCVYLNCHVITGAMRIKVAPSKADTEGGGKFANKADDFITIHREIQDPEKWMQTELHVRKIKEIETGGKYTPSDSPYILTMNKGMCGFSDREGFDPIVEYHKKQGTQLSTLEIDEPKHSLIKPNIEFNPISTPRALREETFPDPDF